MLRACQLNRVPNYCTKYKQIGRDLDIRFLMPNLQAMVSRNFLSGLNALDQFQ